MADRRRIAAALEYLGAMRDRAAEFGSGVAGTLANRARDVGGLAYEALTSDPNIGRMNTAEFSDAAAARAPTPRLDATAQGFGALGKGLITQPIQTGKAVLVDPIVNAFESPRAMGQFAGEVINPLRLASALRRGPMLELEGYQGSPHKFEPTPDNPLGELDSSKIGTGEGAQAYGHGHYIAESRKVGEGYRKALSTFNTTIDGEALTPKHPQFSAAMFIAANGYDNALRQAQEALNSGFVDKTAGAKAVADIQSLKSAKISQSQGGHLYTLDLPDEMIDRMLDWDKPLSEQPEAVKQALMKDARLRSLYERGKIDDMYGNGGEFYRAVTSREAQNAPLHMSVEAAENASQAPASQYLRSLGIPGVRYLDAGSRGGDSATGTRNFVVFPGEEKKVKILRRE
jgi:hypothetical protein